MAGKTNAMRLLDKALVPYTIHEYTVDENDLSGETVALKVGADPDCVFKTLVARGGSNQIYVFCIPVTTELNLRKAATAAGEKRVEMVKVSELLDITGYIRGGCSPLGMKKEFSTFIDETVQLFDFLYCSAGVRGTQIKLRPEDLLNITRAKLADLT